MRRKLPTKNYYPISHIILNTGNGHGSVNTKIRRFSTVQKNVGTAITLVQSATNGDSFTINKNGIYFVHYIDHNSGLKKTYGISKNSTQLTTNIENINSVNRLCMQGTGGIQTINLSYCFYFFANDIIRAHTNGAADQVNGYISFEIFRIW